VSLFDDIEGELENKSYRFIWKKYADYDPYGAECIFGNNGVHEADCNCGGTGILIHKKQIEFHENDSMFRALVAGRGSGKALALDTPIPTPTGWTKMGEIKVGDVVFDETGRKTTVLATYDVDAKKAWRIKFSDGTHLDACEDHQWVTLPHEYAHFHQCADAEWASVDGPLSHIRRHITTSEMVETMTNAFGHPNHYIPKCMPESGESFVHALSAEPIEPMPMRCISVNSKNSMYLAGKGMIPTHNSKSGAAELVKYIVEHPGAKVMIVAPNYGMLHRAAFEYFAPALPPGLIKSSNMQRHEINLVTGGKVWLASAEHPDSLRGPTVSAIWIDEASYLTEETFDILMACLRQTGYPLKLWATSTPKGKNYLWRLWVDSPSKQEELKKDWWYIQFRTHDNPWYPKKMLRALEIKLGDTPWGRQELLGSFEAFAGQIYPYFSRDVHVKDFQAEYRAGRLKFKEIFYAVDWGFADPTVILVCGIGDDNKLYIMEEMYKEGLSMPEVVAEAKALVNKWGKGRFVCDSAGQTQIDTFNKANLPAHDAYKPIMEGITMVGSRLFYTKNEAGEFIVPPRLFFDASCKNTLEEIEVYHYKEKEDGDESKPEPARGQRDHGVDSARYAVMEIEGGQQAWSLVKDKSVLDAINSRPADMGASHYSSLQRMPSAKDLWRIGKRRFRMF
jgi:phage terminase large subunit